MVYARHVQPAARMYLNEDQHEILRHYEIFLATLFF